MTGWLVASRTAHRLTLYPLGYQRLTTIFARGLTRTASLWYDLQQRKQGPQHLILAAKKQAEERADRDKETMFIYWDGERCYVRNEAEGVPEGASFLGSVPDLPEESEP